MRIAVIAGWLLALCCTATLANDADRWQRLKEERQAYREALEGVRREYGGSYSLPPTEFFLFGMGGRDKLVYRNGQLRTAVTDRVVNSWDVADALIVPPAYTVALKTRTGSYVFLFEDEAGVWMESEGHKVPLSRGPVRLPDFTGKRHRLVLRVLHQEMLVNVLDGRPVPNFFVYPKPWYRDAAMMAMAFEKTGNLPLIKDWILSLREPFDKNNGGESEADNLGQALYLISLVSDKSHPLVPAIVKELARFQTQDGKGLWIEGRSDFALHPVYQTKWAKFGLASLELKDPYVVPQVTDSYAALFWWAYKADDKPKQPLLASEKYPYLGWAADHYAGRKGGKLSDRDYPLTWEAEASQARYAGMKRIDPEYARRRVRAPHTWHAAEAFLCLLEQPAN